MGSLLVFNKQYDDLLSTVLYHPEQPTSGTLDRLLSAAADEGEQVTFILCSIDQFDELASNPRRKTVLKKACAGMIGVLVEQTPQDVYLDCPGVNQFLLILPNITCERAHDFAEEIQRRFTALASKIRSRPAVTITMSAACAAFPADADNRADLLRGLRESIKRCQKEREGCVCAFAPPDLEPVKVNLTATQIQALEAIASDQNSAIDALVRAAVDGFLEENRPSLSE
ncbi:MAG: hypothetical protein GC154_06305 [bacterium]|nr:hypothetical protein [bacterium]